MRTRRKFSAYLVMGPDGKTTFEFEPRKEGAGPKKSFFRKGPANGKENGAVLATTVIKAKGPARKRAPKKGD